MQCNPFSNCCHDAQHKQTYITKATKIQHKYNEIQHKCDINTTKTISAQLEGVPEKQHLFHQSGSNRLPYSYRLVCAFVYSCLSIFKVLLCPHFLTFIKYSPLLRNIGISSWFDPFQFAFVSWLCCISRGFSTPFWALWCYCQLLQTIQKLLWLLKPAQPICTRSSSQNFWSTY